MKILMVCMGNICRSPLAEEILRSKLPSDFFVDSAGTIGYHEGEPPDPRSQKVAKKHGLSISHQRARKLRASDFEEFDLILVMDHENYRDVLSKMPDESYKDKVKLILDFAEISSEDTVPDPYYGGESDFEYVYELLDRACTKIAKKLIKG